VAYVSAEDRRRRIIEAAIDVIATEGLSRATTRRIADRAEAPLGALHYCFRNKDEMMELVLAQGSSTIQAAFEPVDPTAGVEATIRAAVTAYWRWIRDNLGLNLAMMELLMWEIRRDKHGKAFYDAVNDPYGGQLLRDKIAAAAELEGVTLEVSPREIVRFMIHRFDGLVFEYAASRSKAACERQAVLLADALIAISQPKVAATS